MVNNGKEIFNIIAELCAYIDGSQPRDYLIRYSCISGQEKHRAEDKIRRNLPELFSCPVRPEEMNSETQDFSGRLAVFAERLMGEDDRNCIMYLLQVLDWSLYPILKDKLDETHRASDLPSLNSNYESTGIELYPKCQCVWARKSRQYFSERRVDNYFQYLVAVERNRIAGIRERHIILPGGFFPDFDRTGELKIAASPVSSGTDFTIHLHRHDEFQTFTLDYSDIDEKRFNQLIWEKIAEAGRNGAELVVFPEMLGAPSMEEDIRGRIKSLTPEEQEKIPAMIILPTVFIHRQNYASILDRRGNLLARQFKQNPYVMEAGHGNYMEGIRGSNVVVVFHYPGIGRFAVMICKDFLTTRYMERIMRSVQLTMIIVPAYSTGAYDFRTSFETCAHDYCNVIWINSCAAMSPGKEKNFRYIGYVRRRITRDQKASDAFCEMKPCEGLLAGECDQKCMYYEELWKV